MFCVYYGWNTLLQKDVGKRGLQWTKRGGAKRQMIRTGDGSDERCMRDVGRGDVAQKKKT